MLFLFHFLFDQKLSCSSVFTLLFENEPAYVS